MFFLLFLFYCLIFIFPDYLIWNYFIMLIILAWPYLLLVVKIFTLIFKFIKLLTFFEFTVKIEWGISILLFIWSIIKCLLSVKFILIIYFHPIILIILIEIFWRNKFVLFVMLIFLLRGSKIKLFILKIRIFIWI